MVDKQTYFENHHHKKTFTIKITWIEAVSFTILSCFAFNSAFVADVATLVFKPEFFTRLQISDLLTNYFCFIVASGMSLVDIL